MNKGKSYSGLSRVPRGIASSSITPGCLVLEGGAFKGVYGEGVQDALMEAGVNLECVIGVSAGAVNGFNYVAGNIGRPARLNLKYRHHFRYVGLFPIIRDGNAIGFSYMFNDYNREEPLNTERFNSGLQRFVVVATDAHTGETVYFEKGTCSDIFKAIRASSAMVYISRAVRVDGRKCLDGAASVKIPYKWAMDQGYEKIVIIHARAKGERRDEKPSVLTRLCYPFRPGFRKTLDSVCRRANQGEEELERLEEAGKVFNIYPSKDLGVSHLEKDMEKMGALYFLGYEDGWRLMDRLKAYLSS